MRYRNKNTLRDRGKHAAKVHIQQYVDGPDKHGIYKFWCGQSVSADRVEVLSDEVPITCGKCLQLLQRREHFNSIRMAR